MFWASPPRCVTLLDPQGNPNVPIRIHPGSHFGLILLQKRIKCTKMHKKHFSWIHRKTAVYGWFIQYWACRLSLKVFWVSPPSWVTFLDQHRNLIFSIKIHPFSHFGLLLLQKHENASKCIKKHFSWIHRKNTVYRRFIQVLAC